MKHHVVIWFLSLGLALGLGWLDYETTSWHTLLCSRSNAISILAYTFLFACLGYGLRWLVKK